MIRFKGVRAQVTALLIAFTLLFSLLFLSMGVVSAYVVEDAIVDRVIAKRANQIELALANSNAINADAANLESGEQLYTSQADVPTQWRKQVVESFRGELFTEGPRHYHYRHINLPTGDIGYLIADVTPLILVTNNPKLFGTFLFSFAVMAIIAVVIAYRLANSITRPIVQLKQAALARSAEASTAMPALSYELGELAQSFEQSFATIESILERERDFTTDVGHELKTPLTELNNLITIAKNDQVDKAHRAQLQLICDRMSNTINVLLALARQENLSRSSCYLLPLIEQVAMQQPAVLNEQFTLEIEADTAVSISANATLFELLVTNIIQNGISHAASPAMHISLDDQAMVFSNEQVAAVSPLVTNAGVKGANSKGVGQGLYLVNRIAKKMGYQMAIDSNENRFILTIRFS